MSIVSWARAPSASATAASPRRTARRCILTFMPEVEVKVPELGEKFRVGGWHRQRLRAADGPFERRIVRRIRAAFRGVDVEDLGAREHTNAHLHFPIAGHGVANTRPAAD